MKRLFILVCGVVFVLGTILNAKAFGMSMAAAIAIGQIVTTVSAYFVGRIDGFLLAKKLHEACSGCEQTHELTIYIDTPERLRAVAESALSELSAAKKTN